ncbi:hypothetical protein LARV_00827 [Longilinea arvoryzae]|uniref:N-acetyltransferase domain-containing protein n=2 Tax=Longilinea arvoryzae TaxID=360412 RepID=A0A0S7BCQ1_9CHLR|nr:hypothetical protein LARV_00827 [Longilinea arvoryzae]
MLTRLRPTNEFFTAVAPSSDGTTALIGQVFYHGGEKSARLSYLLPLGQFPSPALTALVEALAWQAGEWGAFHLLAEVEERSPAFEGLRAAGFSTYARQRVWRIDAPLPDQPVPNHWHAAAGIDEHAVRNLHNLVIPPLVQAAEPLNLHLSHGMIFHRGGELAAYVEVIGGPNGVYLRPLIHPDVEETPTLLTSLITRLHPTPKRPVYVAVRSYEAWLEPPLEDLGASVGPRQALLVRHLAEAQHAMQAMPRLNILENRAEPGAPIARNIQSNTDPVKIQEP